MSPPVDENTSVPVPPPANDEVRELKRRLTVLENRPRLSPAPSPVVLSRQSLPTTPSRSFSPRSSRRGLEQRPFFDRQLSPTTNNRRSRRGRNSDNNNQFLGLPSAVYDDLDRSSGVLSPVQPQYTSPRRSVSRQSPQRNNAVFLDDEIARERRKRRRRRKRQRRKSRHLASSRAVLK